MFFATPGNQTTIQILICSAALLSASCLGTKSPQQFKTMEFKSSQGGFQFQAPSNWSYLKTQGVDSYFGKIATPERDTLYFEMGRYSPTLDRPLHRTGDSQYDDEDFKSRVFSKKLNGYQAKFADYWIHAESCYGIYFDSLWTAGKTNDWEDKIAFTIWGYNLSKGTKKQLNEAVASIKFYKPPFGN
jgi:hypothetical protein